MEDKGLRVTWKSAGQALVVVLAAVMLAAVVFGAAVTWNDSQAAQEIDRLPIQILPWAVEDSPYICFAAMQGDTRLRAMDCLDTTLTR